MHVVTSRYTIGRRELLLGAAAAAALAALLPLSARLVFAAANSDWEMVLRELTGGAKPDDGRISFDIPEIAEDGATVPFTVNVASSMTESDYVKSVHVLATRNPFVEIASFEFTPLSGRASATARMRLAETQDVLALARMSDGSMFMAKRLVKVTVGGCG